MDTTKKKTKKAKKNRFRILSEVLYLSYLKQQIQLTYEILKLECGFFGKMHAPAHAIIDHEAIDANATDFHFLSFEAIKAVRRDKRARERMRKMQQAAAKGKIASEESESIESNVEWPLGLFNPLESEQQDGAPKRVLVNT